MISDQNIYKIREEGIQNEEMSDMRTKNKGKENVYNFPFAVDGKYFPYKHNMFKNINLYYLPMIEQKM